MDAEKKLSSLFGKRYRSREIIQQWKAVGREIIQAMESSRLQPG